MDYLKLKRLIKEGVQAQLLYESKLQRLFEEEGKKVPALEDTGKYKQDVVDNSKELNDYMQAIERDNDKKKANKYDVEIGDPAIYGHDRYGNFLDRRFGQIKDVTIAAFIQAFSELSEQHTTNNPLIASITKKELIQLKRLAQEINTYAPGHMWGTFCSYLVKIKSNIDEKFKAERKIDYNECRSLFLDIIVSNLEKLSGYLLKIKNKMKGEEAANREKCITAMSTAIIAMVERVFKYRKKNKSVNAVYEYSDIEYEYSDKYNPKSSLESIKKDYPLNTDKIFF